jgi:putative tricarboxylic transport membrane protein
MAQHTRKPRYLTAAYHAALGVIAACLIGGLAQAQSWKPEKPVELIAASGPGGNTDKLARTIQRILQDEKLVTVPINVVNKTGGNQTIARVYLNQFPGDAHYMELSNPTLISNNVMGITSQKPSDFSPLVLLLDEYSVFSVRADSPYKTGAELLRHLAQQPDSLSIGLTTRGGANHIALALAAKAAGVDLKRLKIVSFRSNSESVTALLGGHIDLVASSASPAISHFQQGRTRIVAISAPRRMSGVLAQVPTLKEQQVPAVNSNWRALVGPKGLQPVQIAYWEEAAGRLAKTERWKKELEMNFWEHHLLQGQALRDFLADEAKETREILSEVGLAK